MQLAAIILTSVFGLLAALVTMLAGASSSKANQKRFPFLRKVKGREPQLTIAAIVFVVLSYASTTWKEMVGIKPIVTSRTREGSLAQQGTLEAFREALKGQKGPQAKDAEVYFTAADLDMQRGFYEDAARAFQKSIDLVPALPSYANLGLALAYMHELPAAIDVFTKALQVAQQQHNRYWEAAAIGNRGRAYQEQSRFDQALSAHQTALDIGKELKSASIQAIARHNIGNIHQEMALRQPTEEEAKKQWQQALDSYQAAQTLYRSVGDRLNEANVEGTLGTLSMDQGAYDQALHHFQTEYGINKQLHNPVGQAYAKSDMADAYLAQERWDEALAAHQEALGLDQQTNNMFAQAEDLMKIGDVYALKNDPDAALERYQSALEICERFRAHPAMVADLFTRIGTTEVKQGRVQEGIDALHRARRLVMESGSSGQVQALDRLIDRLGLAPWARRQYFESSEDVRDPGFLPQQGPSESEWTPSSWENWAR